MLKPIPLVKEAFAVGVILAEIIPRVSLHISAKTSSNGKRLEIGTGKAADQRRIYYDIKIKALRLKKLSFGKLILRKMGDNFGHPVYN